MTSIIYYPLTIIGFTLTGLGFFHYGTGAFTLMLAIWCWLTAMYLTQRACARVWRAFKNPKCVDCGRRYEPWPSLTKDGIGDPRCLPCNEARWKEWEEEHSDEMDKCKELEAAGHPVHCACRQVWGDGWCECDTYAMGYDPYAWMGQFAPTDDVLRIEEIKRDKWRERGIVELTDVVGE